MRISFASPAMPRSGAIVAWVAKGKRLSATAERLDRQTGGAVKRAISASRFNGARGQSLSLIAPAGIKASRIILAGLGDPAALDAVSAQNLGGSLVAQLSAVTTAAIAADPVRGAKLKTPEFAANIAYGALLRSYRFDKYRTKEAADDKPALRTLTVMCGDAARARRLHGPMAKVAGGVFMTRDLVSEPANVIYPVSLAARARTLTKLGVKVQVLDKKQMQKLGMGALLGVAQGSANAPRLVVMRWNGLARARDRSPIAFVGKGVTFDTGGISIKPSANMEDMKWDMGGAGVVIGLMRALAARKAKVNVVGVVGLVENMPSHTAQRPGDVVKSMSGQTIEVINTDAEGRLVLADALWYCQEKYRPRTIIDLATLTGAIIVALGSHQAGIFANDDKLAERLAAAGTAVGEPVWRMPLGEDYDKQINSDIADMKNVGGRGAGSITAAQFLQRFIQKDVAWAHIDIAGVTWSGKSMPTVPKGGTAFGVRLLDRLVADNYERR
jgi:leucyl aminopeptidase